MLFGIRVAIPRRVCGTLLAPTDGGGSRLGHRDSRCYLVFPVSRIEVWCQWFLRPQYSIYRRYPSNAGGSDVRLDHDRDDGDIVANAPTIERDSGKILSRVNIGGPLTATTLLLKPEN